MIETLFRIVDKQGEVVDFLLNPYQRELDIGWGRRNLVPKARRLGMSAYIDARFLAKCLGMENRRCVIISHDADATRMLLDRVRFTVSNIKGVPIATGGTDNRGQITFPKTNSSIYIGTAGSRNFGRGDTITDLHCSEIAFWQNPQKLVRGLFQAAKAGEITVESTGNGVGNWYHRQAKLAESGRGFKLHFFSWLKMVENTLPFSSESEKLSFMEMLQEELEEPSLKDWLTPEQLNWRRDTIVTEFDSDLRVFKAEYPLTLDECFQSTGFTFFPKKTLTLTDRWVRRSRNLWELEGHPRHDYTYCIGADVSGGVGRDRSVSEVICVDTNEQVAEYSNDFISPDDFGIFLAAQGRRFNEALINPERNNHGLTTISTLLANYPPHKVYKSRIQGQGDSDISKITAYGTYTEEVNRGFLIGNLKKDLAKTLIIHSPALNAELDTFVETESGKVEADAGAHDDKVIALGLANNIRVRAALIADASRPSNVSLLDPFSLDSMLAQLEGKYKSSPASYLDAVNANINY